MLEPLIRTDLPGPKARAIIERDEAFSSTSYIKEYPLVVDRGEGSWLYDVDGNRFLDMMAGIAVNSTGYQHPKVVQALREHIDKVWHFCGTDFYSAPFSMLLERLAGLLPSMGECRVFVTNSGTEAVEAAIKLARSHTRRQGLAAFAGAFHGRTTGAMALSTSKIHHRAKFGPFFPGVVHLPFPDVTRRGIGETEATVVERCLASIEQEYLGRIVDPEDLAAIFVEPIQGEGGYRIAPAAFLQGLRKLCDRHGIILVFDEIQSGIGRTGKMLAAEHTGVSPDVLLVGKGLGSGLPIGAMIARSNVMTWARGSHGSTFGGNNLAAATALATLSVVDELLPHVQQAGAILMRELENLQTRHSAIFDVRGKGLMLGVELADPVSSQPLKDTAARLIQGAFRRGLLLLGCGTSTIRFAPPLVISRREIEVGVRIFDEILTHVA